MRPILQSSCARATTAEEAAFRIDAPVAGRPGARVVALDDGAATIVRRLGRAPWHAARFYTLSLERPAGGSRNGGPDGADPDPGLLLHSTTGRTARLVDELAEADVTVMVATGQAGSAAARAAAAIGRACARRGVMTAGVALGASESSGVVGALRPHARVLLVGADDEDVTDLLSAIRA